MKVMISCLMLVHATLSWVKPDRTLIKTKGAAPWESGECDPTCEVSCTMAPPPDCADWGDCEIWQFCMARLDGCPPPPAYCDWETQNSCYIPAPEDCERGCWGEEFCIPGHEACPPPPVYCGDSDVKCSQPPDPNCADWGDCNVYEFCMHAEEGCPPPPVQCDWDTQTSCWNPSPPECEFGCWGTEFCSPHDEGCPPWPVHCAEGDVKCTDPPFPGCEEWGPGACHPMEFCMPEHDGCPPPPVHCDWETQTLCYSPPHPDCDGPGCWGTEFCSGPEGCPREPVTCGEGERVCSDPPAPDCAEWGSCEPYEWCNAGECPPPPVNCDWAHETSCWTPPPNDCEGGCWGSEFCAPMDEGCPMPPLDCGKDALTCVQPPPPDCADWGMCDDYEWCMDGEYYDLSMGCPPPPAYCDWEGDEVSCYNPPAEECKGVECWGHEFCESRENGCPPIPVTCHDSEIKCSEPPWPDCEEWGQCNPFEFCMQEEEGCPPPPVHCDWDTEHNCYNPPADDCEKPNCWGTEWCVPADTDCDGKGGGGGGKDDDTWFGFIAQKAAKKKPFKAKKLRGKHSKMNGPAALSRSMYRREQVARMLLHQQHKPTPGMFKKPTQHKRTKQTQKQHSRSLGMFKRVFINYRRMIDGVKHKEDHKKDHKKVSAPKRPRLLKNAGAHMMYEFRRVRHEKKSHPKSQKQVRRAK